MLLANKSDVDTAQDEVEVVSQLDIESLVNSAQCPTRVESSVATKNQGLREGYKWLVKSIIANYADLGDRVNRDIETEKKAEEERRKEVRRRIEERRKKEEEEMESNGHTDNHEEDNNPPGFIPVDQLKVKWANSESDKVDVSSHNQDLHNATSAADDEPLSARKLVNKLELEPIHGPKKRGLLSKLNKFANKNDVRSLESGVSSDTGDQVSRTGAHTGYRNWGLAEDLEPSVA